MAVAVEWEPSALDSCDDRGLRVLISVRDSGDAEGAVVKWGMASACDAPSEEREKTSATVAPVPDVNAVGGEDVAVMSSLGAAKRTQTHSGEHGHIPTFLRCAAAIKLKMS